jgi:type IV pilus assembly protein PilB
MTDAQTKTPQDNKSQSLEKALEEKLSTIESGRLEEAAKEKAKALGLPFSDLRNIPIDAEVLTLIDEVMARKAGVAAIYREKTKLTLAVLDPQSSETKEVIGELTKRGFEVVLVVASSASLVRVWERYAGTVHTEEFEVGAIELQERTLATIQEKINTLADLRTSVEQASATELLDTLVAGAIKMEASDIHFEPERKDTRLRYRLDGLLQDVTNLDTGSYKKTLNRIKILSKLKLNIHTAAQDGRFTIRQGEISIEVRVSVLPSEYGETTVMRLLDPRTIRTKLEDLGMRMDVLEVVKTQIQRPTGAILTTGPTGSGKTTTLYTLVQFLNAKDTKIITIEDPIEYHAAGVSQTQVDPDKGYDFANGLRSIVRQDPDVILVGEIRDRETAEIAMDAALTGHLVFSTIHTNDAAGTVPRLIELGVRPETIAPALTLAMGQRLIRRLCEKCKTRTELSRDNLKMVQDSLNPLRERFGLKEVTDKTIIYSPKGCEKCNDTGYRGRIGVYEVFMVTRDMEKLILSSPAISEVRDQAVKEGMVTMLQDGYLKLISGVTSLEEIHRVLGI